MPDKYDAEDKEVYDDEGREDLLKDDEISPEEQAFMAGYESAGEEKEESDDEDYEKAYDAAKKTRKKK
ncbi:hypothetical protein ACFL1B_05725 [Nanoarchaeota archaeon]